MSILSFFVFQMSKVDCFTKTNPNYTLIRTQNRSNGWLGTYVIDAADIFCSIAFLISFFAVFVNQTCVQSFIEIVQFVSKQNS